MSVPPANFSASCDKPAPRSLPFGVLARTTSGHFVAITRSKLDVTTPKNSRSPSKASRTPSKLQRLTSTIPKPFCNAVRCKMNHSPWRIALLTDSILTICPSILSSTKLTNLEHGRSFPMCRLTKRASFVMVLLGPLSARNPQLSASQHVAIRAEKRRFTKLNNLRAAARFCCVPHAPTHKTSPTLRPQHSTLRIH